MLTATRSSLCMTGPSVRHAELKYAVIARLHIALLILLPVFPTDIHFPPQTFMTINTIGFAEL